MNRSGDPSRDYIDETIDGGADEVRQSSSVIDLSSPRVVLAAGPRKLADEIRDLLHTRLRMAVLLLLLPSIVLLIRRWLNWHLEDGPDTQLLIVCRYVVLGGLLIGTALLWSPIRFTLSELRAIELAVFGLPCFLFLLLHQNMLQGAAMLIHSTPLGTQSVERDVVRGVVRTISLMWFALMVVYGTFIPNSIRRGAVAAGMMAIAPLTIVGITAWQLPVLRPAIVPDEFTMLFATLAAGFVISLYGTYKIGALRREAFEARQLGQYRLTECIGAGGMGEVHLAEHRMLKRPCAIKLIRPAHLHDAKALARFEREVRAIARLTHWNTVEIFDYGRTEEGTFYYAMEYLPGLSLQEVVERQGKLQPERAVHLLRQVCGALIEAHAAGIVHRDIKPSNIIASQRGGVCDVAKLVDFGLATMVEEATEIKLTQEGAIAGSPLYMSPERFLEDDDPDARSDIYSLGAVGYYLLTGQPPFRGDTPVKVMIAHAREPVVPLRQLDPDLPDDLEQIILRCLAKTPEQRFQTVRELEQALAACACADGWTQEMAAQWWISRPDTISLETQDETVEATIV